MSLTPAYPVRAVCAVRGLPRSSFYYQSAPASGAAAALREAVVRLAGEWPTYGYRRLTAQLRREGQVVTGKRVRRLMAELGMAAQPTMRS